MPPWVIRLQHEGRSVNSTTTNSSAISQDCPATEDDLQNPRMLLQNVGSDIDDMGRQAHDMRAYRARPGNLAIGATSCRPFVCAPMHVGAKRSVTDGAWPLLTKLWYGLPDPAHTRFDFPYIALSQFFSPFSNLNFSTLTSSSIKW